MRNKLQARLCSLSFRPEGILNYVSHSSNYFSTNPAQLLPLSHYNYYSTTNYLPLAWGKQIPDSGRLKLAELRSFLTAVACGRGYTADSSAAPMVQWSMACQLTRQSEEGSPPASTSEGSDPFSFWCISKHCLFSMLTAHNSCPDQASNKHRLSYPSTSVTVKEVFSQTIPLKKIFSPTDAMWQFFIIFSSNLNF